MVIAFHRLYKFENNSSKLENMPFEQMLGFYTIISRKQNQYPMRPRSLK